MRALNAPHRAREFSNEIKPMQPIANALADPDVRAAYLVLCLLIMGVPMIVLTIWYRKRIGQMPGGEAIQREQDRIGVWTPRAWQAIGFARDIAAGRYGVDVRNLINTLYLVVAIWAAVNAVTFGILIWADEVNRP